MAGRKPISETDEPRLLAALSARPLRDQAWILMGMHCGFRVRELMNLDVSHVYADGRVKTQVKLERAKLKGGRGKRRRAVGSRTVPLNAAIAPALQKYLFARFGSGGPTLDEPLFPSRNYGGRLSRWRANQIVREVLQAAGIQDVEVYGTHSLRKRFCRCVYRATGNDIAVTRVAMGHASIATTQKYLVVEETEVTDAIMRIGQPTPAAVPSVAAAES